MDLADVRDRCKEAAAAIAKLPIAEWPRWVAYILEVLDGQSGWTAEGKRDMLRQVKEDLQARLRGTLW